MSNLKYVIGASSEVVLAAAKRDMGERSRGYERNFSPQGTETFLGIKEPRKRENVEDINNIDSDTFKPTGKELGYGCWGIVDEYIDAGEQKWAIKTFNPDNTAQKQMKERGWNKEDVMRKESIPLDAAHYHIVPRIIERDKKGQMYIAMPVYEEGDLSKKINHINLEHALTITKDVAKALSYIHNQEEVGASGFKKRKAHGDIKPSNILIKNGRAFLTDFGSTTCISINGNGSKRGPHGDENYRAPECFDENANPSARADVWSLGAIFYEAIAKEGIYNGIRKTNQREISRKINKVPRPFRRFFEKCLSIYPNERFEDGEALEKGMEKAIKKYEKTTLPSRLKRYGVTATAATIIAGTLAAFFGSNKEVKGLEQKVSQLNNSRTQDKRQKIIDLYLQREGQEAGINFSYSYDMFAEDGKLASALFKFKDKKVGIAAYIDPNSVFASMMDAGIDSNDLNFSYEKIEPFLKEKDSDAYWEIWGREHTYYDIFALRLRSNKYERFEKEWAAAKQIYKQEEIEKERVKKRELEKQRKREETHKIAIRIK